MVLKKEVGKGFDSSELAYKLSYLQLALAYNSEHRIHAGIINCRQLDFANGRLDLAISGIDL